MTASSPAHSSARFLGRYELMYLLGQGGMGEVHLARLTGAAGFEKLCIVKTILPQMMTDPQFVDRFHHEAKVLVQLNHSNIAQVYDMGDVDETLYMAIEYVPGVDLARVEDRARAMDSAVPVPVALLIGQQMCEALGYAHRKMGADGAPLGIVHRDVSPQNVMVSYEGEVKVIDFGLAKSSARSKHTLPSTVLGKLGYMSPEQARAEKVDHRSDIYSAGIVIWELLAGRPFITGGTVGEMVAQMANPKIPPLREIRPEISEAVERIVVRALQADPNARYNRADDFARAINEQLVRENMSVGSEDVGNYVRAMCPEEFAAERKLQSRLSTMRKKGGSSPSVSPQARSSGPLDGTMVRAPASSVAAGVVQPAVRTPKPQSGNGAVPLTAAQKAISTVWMDQEDAGGDTLPPQPAYQPGQQVGGASSAPNVIVQQPSTPALSGEYQVPKSKAPMIIVLLFALIALGGGGYFAWEQFGGQLFKPAEPLVVDPPPPPKKDDAVEVAKVDQPAVKKDEPEKTEPAKVDPAKTDAVEPKNVPAPVKLERIEVKGPVWKIIRDDDKHYVQVTGKPKLVVGDEVKVLGPELDKAQREVYGIASVVEVKGSLARLIIDEDTQMPTKAFAVKELGPKRAARLEAKRQAEAAKTAQPGSEPAKTDPAKTEPAKTEPAKTDSAKVEPAKTEPAKTDVAVAKNDHAQAEPHKNEPQKVEHVAKTEPAKTDKAPAPSSYKTLTGGIVLGRGGRKVHIFNRNDFNWHGCEVWTPTKKHFKYDPEAEIAAGDSDGVDYGRFEDFTKPEDPQFANGWALVRCKEGAGYVQFKAN